MVGVSAGSMTWRGFRILDEAAAQEHTRDSILRGLEKAGFAEADVEQGEREAQGLVVFDDILNRDFEAAAEATFVGPWVLCTFRRDTLRLPGPYLKALVKAEVRRTKERSGRTRLGRAEKAEIRERVELMLLKRALPSVQTADIAWSLTDHRVRIFAGSAALVEAAAETFEAAFDLDLRPQAPFVRLQDLGWSEKEIEDGPEPVPLFLPALLGGD